MSKLEVCNQALLLVKQPPIFDLDATSSQSRDINIIYDRSYAHLLSSHYFNYALKVAELVTITGVTPFVGFSSVREMPQGALSLKDVVDADERQVQFRIGADGIHVKSSDKLYAEYTYLIDIDKTSALFRTALAYYMAKQLIGKVTATGVTQQLMNADFLEHWGKCVAHDGVHEDIKLVNQDVYGQSYLANSPYAPNGRGFR
jgi:hypothetical protein